MPAAEVPDDDELDGCEVDFTVAPTSDEDLAAVVLFAGVDPNDVPLIAERYRELFGG